MGCFPRAHFAAAVLVGLAFGAPRSVHAEPYIAVFGGTAFTESKTDDTRLALDNTTVLDGKFSDVDLHNSLLVGAKAG